MDQDQEKIRRNHESERESMESKNGLFAFCTLDQLEADDTKKPVYHAISLVVGVSSFMRMLNFSPNPVYSSKAHFHATLVIVY